MTRLRSVAGTRLDEYSDVDIVVDLKQPVTFDRYMDVKFYLEDHLNVPVDLVTWKSLKLQLRSIVEQAAIYVL